MAAKKKPTTQDKKIVNSGSPWETSSTSVMTKRIDDPVSPIPLQDVEYGGRVFRFRKPLVLRPCRDETGELLVIEHEPLGIHVFAESREELVDELREQIAVLWDEYACEEDRNLSPAAIKLKRRLREALEER